MIKRFKLSVKSCIAVCFVALSVASFSTQAQTDTSSEKITPHERCMEIAEVAQVMMMARQEGVPLTELLKEGGIRDDPLFEVLYESMLFIAYDLPVFDTKEEKERASNEFSNQYYLVCRKALEKQD